MSGRTRGYDYTIAVRDHSKAKGPARLVMYALASRADKDGICFPSYATIVKDTGLSLKTVVRAIKEIIQSNELVVAEKGKAAGRSTHYQITINCSQTDHSQTDHSQNGTTMVRESTTMVRESANYGQSDHLSNHKEVTNEVTKELTNTSSSPSSQTQTTKKREHAQPDRFASEEEVIRFVFSDLACRELKCLQMDARWFWNCMTEQSWHRDSKEKQPVKDAKAVCRKWMSFESRPSMKTFRYKLEDHIERWKREERLHRPEQNQSEILDAEESFSVNCITGKREYYRKKDNIEKSW